VRIAGPRPLVALLAAVALPLSLAATVASPTAVGAESAAAPPAPYSCGVQGNQTVSGTFGDAGLIGWAGDKDGVVACLGGSFYVRDGKNTTYGYGVYDNATTTWKNADGYLPALVTTFHRDGARISITNFGDAVRIGGHRYVAVYSRVAVHNPTTKSVTINPFATPGLTKLHGASNQVAPGKTVNHDYVVAADRFGKSYSFPSGKALKAAGGYAKHFAHMKSFWNHQLTHIANVAQLPDHSLVNAYKAGFINTQIIRDGTHLTTGENGYDMEFSHDVIGILANLIIQGDDKQAKRLMIRARHVIGIQRQYDDGVWKYPWLWAEYILKTGNVGFAKAHFSKNGPTGATEPSIKDTAHQIAKERTGPGGIMKETSDIDANGFWTIDDYSALFGLAAYRYVAKQVGAHGQVTWAKKQYASLLKATNKTLNKTISTNHLNYLPCSMTEPNTSNRCSNPEDANWAAPFLFGRWAWDGYLFGAHIAGPGKSLIDATYNYGFGRLQGKLPANTLGGYSPDFYSTGYNAGYGSWGLASNQHRDQGILGYEFMVKNSQSGPFAWWESAANPNPGSPWKGVHPASGNGSSPHAWGIANANMALLDSLLAQRSNGQLLVGRGVPTAWLAGKHPVVVRNFPTTEGHHVGASIVTHGKRVKLTMTGDRPAGDVVFDLPAFRNGIASANRGHIDNAAGTVTIPAGTHRVTVHLKHTP
jgi:hypothetical protein